MPLFLTRIWPEGRVQSQQFRLSLMNSDSASLTIVLRQSHNCAPKIPEFVPVSPSSTTRHQSRPRSTYLSGNLTADTPGKSDASERRPANKRENFPCRSCLLGGLGSI